MSYYGKKAQVRSDKSDKSANPEFQKAKRVNNRKIRYDYRDDYRYEYNNRQDSQLYKREIETYSTEDLVNKRNAEFKYENEKSADEYISNKTSRSRQTTKKNNYRRSDYDKKAYSLKAESSNNTNQTASDASNNVGSKASGYVGAAKGIKDSVTPESLKIQNYSARKSARRYKEMQNKENGNIDAEENASNKAGEYVKSFGQKLGQVWVNTGKLLWSINWIAGLVYTAVSILLVVVFLLIIIVTFIGGNRPLPAWSQSSIPSVKLLMTDYEYIWDSAVYEVGDRIERNNSISIPIDPSGDNIKLGNSITGAKYINWREVLAVYYAGMQSKSNENRKPEDDLVDFDSNDKAINLIKPGVKSYFNTVFWNMHNIMPVRDFTYQDNALKNRVNNNKIDSYCFTVCYKPELNIVMSRLGFTIDQQTMVNSYLSSEYDEYFNDIINNRYVSASKAVAEFAAGEIGNHGSKYNNWYGAAPGTSWCQIFIEYVLNKTGYRKLASGAGGVTSAYNYYKHNPKVATIHVVEGKRKDNLGVTPQPGWLVIFEWADGVKYRDHIGMVESYNSNTGIVTTIEGNTWVGIRKRGERTKVCRLHRKVGISPEKKHIYAFVELGYPKSKQNAAARTTSKGTNRYKETAHYSKICNAATSFLNSNPEKLAAMKYSVNFFRNGVPEWYFTEARKTNGIETSIRLLSFVNTTYNSNHGKEKSKWKDPGIRIETVSDKNVYNVPIVYADYYGLLSQYYRRLM